MQAIDAHLNNQTYAEDKVPGWINRICEDVMEGLADLKKPFKYICTCVIMQNTGAGMHTEHSGFCDTVNDGMHVVKWPADKSKDQNTMYCIVTVYGLGF